MIIICNLEKKWLQICILQNMDMYISLSLYAFLPFQDDQSSSDKSDDLVKVLRELTVVQRNIANLQVELQGRKVMDWRPAVSAWMLH
jgi:hypothetical protein